MIFRKINHSVYIGAPYFYIDTSYVSISPGNLESLLPSSRVRSAPLVLSFFFSPVCHSILFSSLGQQRSKQLEIKSGSKHQWNRGLFFCSCFAFPVPGSVPYFPLFPSSLLILLSSLLFFPNCLTLFLLSFIAYINFAHTLTAVQFEYYQSRSQRKNKESRCHVSQGDV